MGLIWLAAVQPDVVTPMTWQKGGVSAITFYSQLSSPLINVVRTVKPIAHNHAEIDDEVFSGHSRSMQLTYRFGETPEQYDPRVLAPEQFGQVIVRLNGLIAESGSSIVARNRDHGVEAHFVSMGGAWIPGNESSRQMRHPLPLPRGMVTPFNLQS